MSPFSPYSKQSTHILQQEMDRKAGRGRGEGGKGEKLFNDPINKIQSEATLIHPGFFFFF